MRSRAPIITLAVLVATAVIVLLTGAWMARRTELVREERSRDALRAFADTLASELERLEQHYEEHLRRIVRDAPASDDTKIRNLCNEVEGIRQFSVIQPANSSKPDAHVVTAIQDRYAVIVPTFRPTKEDVTKFVQLREDLLYRVGVTSGWIAEPSQSFFFWTHRDDGVAVLLIDRSATAVAIDRWLRRWAKKEFSAVRLTGGPDRLLGAGQAVLASTERLPDNPDRPDFLLPVRGRFGTWQLVSYDRISTRVTYHLPTLIGSAAIAVVIAVVGIIVSRQQRRALTLASQRVSFVNRVSHELRAPMTNIMLNLDLATDAMEAGLPYGSERLGLVREEACRLGRMIENVLTFSRSEEGRLDMRPRACRADHVIDAVIDQFRAAFERQLIRVQREADAAGTCVLDADALAQIVSNLLSNVEKYAAGATVRIESRLTGDELTVVVADAGPGIPAAATARIFLPFERLDSRTIAGVTGTGLGLSIARELAERSGGSLRLIPAEKGAHFELRVPAPAVSEPTAVTAA